MELHLLKRSLILFVLLTVACHTTELDSDAASSPELASRLLGEAAEKSRISWSRLSFEEFEKKVYKEPFDGGKYIVNGDTTIANKKLLREFYQRKIKIKPQLTSGTVPEFIIHSVGGLDALWSQKKKGQLSYCVSRNFGDHYQQVVDDMTGAASAWEAAAAINFIHKPEHDERCDATNESVLFDVRPVDVAGRYLARAFFPNEAREGRNILIDQSSFRLKTGESLTLRGILRHELGHVIGARHEHTRPDSGECFEDENWRPLTNYDAFSVMHYPHCGGRGDWSLTLTHSDKNGAACVYGPAEGFTIDEDVCTWSPSNTAYQQETGITKVQVFKNQKIAGDSEKLYPTLQVVPGSPFHVTMSPVDADSGDPDLYLGFDMTPDELEYDCRPFRQDASEVCDVIVPDDTSIARIKVRGFTAGKYELKVEYTEPQEE